MSQSTNFTWRFLHLERTLESTTARRVCGGFNRSAKGIRTIQIDKAQLYEYRTCVLSNRDNIAIILLRGIHTISNAFFKSCLLGKKSGKADLYILRRYEIPNDYDRVKSQSIRLLYYF